MTLRQEYAKAAMQGMMADGICGSVQSVAQAAFDMADAMLIHEKQEQEDMERRRNQ